MTTLSKETEFPLTEERRAELIEKLIKGSAHFNSEGIDWAANLLRSAAAALTRTHPSIPVSEWQDIATAPKDGTMLLLAANPDGHIWWKFGVGFYTDSVLWDWPWGFQPSHWAKLVAPDGGPCDVRASLNTKGE